MHFRNKQKNIVLTLRQIPATDIPVNRFFIVGGGYTDIGSEIEQNINIASYLYANILCDIQIYRRYFGYVYLIYSRLMKLIFCR